MLSVGEKTWLRGDEITITSEPFELYGKMWQNGITENGKTVTIPTHEQKLQNVKKQQNEWTEQQRQFSQLRKNQNGK